MKRISHFIVLFCIVCHSLQAQSLDSPIYTKDKKIPAYYAVPDDADIIKREVNSSGIDTQICRLLKLNKETSLVLCDTLTDIVGGFHETYKQLYKGIEVEGTKCVVHYNNTGIAKMISGNLKTIEKLAVTPKITAWQSKSIAIETIEKDESLAECLKRGVISRIDDSLINCNEGTLVVFVSNDVPHLAYKHYIRSKIQSLNKRIYIDAETGDYLGGYSTVYNMSTNASTVYSGVRPIETQYLNNRYVLRDNTRGNGVMTLQQSGNDYESTNNTWSNLSDYDRAAIDAHWGVEKTYDFYYSKFGRNSYDNNGSSITSYVNVMHYYENYGWILWQNAGWDDVTHCMYYGRFSSTLPMVSLDVTAHELTHGVTQYTSALNYERESGAINEGMSDVFAVCVENEYKTNSEIWKMGEDFFTGGLRDLSNPTCKFYHGNGWVITNQTPTEYNDYCGVHTNSGVFGYWFYLLAHGGSGTNEAGNSYSVSSIGLSNAIQICYLANAAFLCSDSNYPDARFCTLFAAQSLGYNSNIINQINKAWDAVGVGNLSGPTIPCGNSVYSIDNLPSGCTVNWSWYNFYDPALSADPTLQQNTPSTNMCTISNNSQLHIHNILVADIYRNNTQVATFKKEINTGLGFSTNITGTYMGLVGSGMDPTPDIPSTTIYDNDTLRAMGGYQLTMTSDAFSTHTVGYTGTVVKNWTNYGNGTITVRFNNLNSSSYVTVYGTNGCQHFQYRIYVKKNMVPFLRDESVSISTTDKLCTVNLDIDAVDISGNRIDSEEISNSSLQWHYSVVNVLTGNTILENDAEGTTTTFDLSKYPSGVYVIKVEMDDQTVSKKISI